MSEGDLRKPERSSPPPGDALAAIGLEHLFAPDGRDRLLHDLSHDPLTGLPNRAAFQRLATSAIAACPAVVLLLIDLDHFKLINDGLGHDRGDALLVEVARRFRRACPAGALLARIGGDNFTVLLRSDRPMADAAVADAKALADRLRGSLLAPLELGGRRWTVSCSVGIAHAESVARSGGERGDANVGDLLRDAEVAMYRAKTGGRDRAVVFDPAMHAAAVKRLNLEADLHAALERDEFVLHLQPLVRLADDRLKGFEALARWQRGGELVMPGGFISVLEDTGLVVPFGYCVIRQACAILRDWGQLFPSSDLPPLSVNLSARQFEDPALFDTICAIVSAAGVSPTSLRFEIVESLLMQSPEHVADVLRRLTLLGFGVSLDDFGTGFSSLGYLQSFPVDSLKIDRSFVARMGEEGGNLRIVRAIGGLAASLGLSVVGEGVETASQAALLRKLGCEYGQGYYFGRPVPVAEATRLVAQSQSPLCYLPLSPPRAGEQAAVVPASNGGARPLPSGEEPAPGARRPPRPARPLAAVRPFALLLAAPVLMALHAGLMLAAPAHKATISGLILTVGPMVAAASCARAARATGSGLRVNWMIAALAFVFWATGSLTSVWLPMGTTANLIDFVYFLCAASLIFAMTTPENDEPRWLFLLMDSIQALLAVGGGYIVFFGSVPFTADRVVPLSENAIISAYDIENVCLLVVACLRLLGSDGSAERQRFDLALIAYTLLSGTASSFYNHFAPANPSVIDIALDPGFFLVAWLAMRPRQDAAGTRETTPAVAFLATVGPAFITAAVLIVAASIARQRLLPGIVGIVATVSIYALRVSLLQARHVMTQQHLRRTRDRLESLALEDGLTRVGNRRAFDTTLAALWSDSERRGSPLSALLLDVDFFRAYNDRHGHLTGDSCLASVAAELVAIVGERGGFVARHGGEEFAILLRDASAADARAAADTIREAVGAMDIRSHTGTPAPITVSIGVSTSTGTTSARGLILAADDALCRAKRRGRDRVEAEWPAALGAA